MFLLLRVHGMNDLKLIIVHQRAESAVMLKVTHTLNPDFLLKKINRAT
jgi:hypothetical protein